jgi:hypothetical protein
MLRQYGPQRFRYAEIRGRHLPVGVIPVGSIYRYQAPRAARPRAYMVVAWLPRQYARADHRNGRAGFCYLARGGHLALVRELATGRVAMMADHIIRGCLDDE